MHLRTLSGAYTPLSANNLQLNHMCMSKVGRENGSKCAGYRQQCRCDTNGKSTPIHFNHASQLKKISEDVFERKKSPHTMQKALFTMMKNRCNAIPATTNGRKLTLACFSSGSRMLSCIMLYPYPLPPSV